MAAPQNKIRSVSLAMTVAMVLAVAPALARAQDPAAAEGLFRDGRALMKRGQLGAACNKLAESVRLDPGAVGALMNLAECESQIGRTASAWQKWQLASERLHPGDRRLTTALARIHALEAKLARLVVTLPPSAPAGLEIRRDGVVLDLDRIGTPIPVDPGTHALAVTAPGRQARELEISLRQAEQKTVLVEPGPPALARPALALISVSPPPFVPIEPPPRTAERADPDTTAVRTAAAPDGASGGWLSSFLGYTLITGGAAVLGGTG